MSGNGSNDPWFKSSSMLPLHAVSSGCRMNFPSCASEIAHAESDGLR